MVPIHAAALLRALLQALCLCALVRHSHAVRTYRAAAVQYPEQGTWNGSATDILTRNLLAFTGIARQLQAQGVQIAVFPEAAVGWGYAWTMAGRSARDAMQDFAEQLPNVVNGAPRFVPCQGASTDSAGHALVRATDNPWLSFAFGPQAVHLSCMARDANMVVVANVATIVPCSASSDPSCPADGRYQYNTDVAYGAQGELLAIYHKSHLHGESDAFDQPEPMEPVFFDAPSVGVRFAVLVCHDIEFPEPIATYRRWGVTDIVFSSQWLNHPPVITAVEMQAGRAALEGVNLIASNSAWGPDVSGGGIFSRNQVLSSYFNYTDKMYVHLNVADVPIFNDSSTLSSMDAESPDLSALDLDLDLAVRLSDLVTTPMSAAESESYVRTLVARKQRSCQRGSAGAPSSLSNLSSLALSMSCGNCSFSADTAGAPDVACCSFDALDAQSIAQAGGQWSLVSAAGGIECQFLFAPAISVPPLAGNVTSAHYALIAIDATFIDPNTPDHLRGQACLLVQCPFPPACFANVWQAPVYNGFGAMVVASSKMLSDLDVMPFQLLGGGQVSATPSVVVGADGTVKVASDPSISGVAGIVNFGFYGMNKAA